MVSTSYPVLFWQQLRTLLWKNFLVDKRSWKLSILRLLLPSLFVIVFYIIYHYTTQSNPPTAHLIGNVPKCTPGITPSCITVAYYPDSPEVRNIMKTVGQYNDPPLTLGTDIIPIQNFVSVENFRLRAFWNQTNTTQSAIIFSDLSAPGPWSYYILYNDTTDSNSNLLDFSYNPPEAVNIRLQLQIAVDRAFAANFSENANFDLEVSALNFPPPWDLTKEQVQALVGSLGLTFFYLGLSATLILALNAIVTEKERNIRGYLRSFGMMDGPYWLSWFIEMMTFHTLSVFIMMAFGYIFPGLNFFHKGNFFSNFFIFLVYGMELICLSFLLSSIVSKTRAANILGFVLYFFGLGVAIAFSFIGGTFVWELYNPDIIDEHGDWANGLSFFPALLFSFTVLDVQARTIGSPFGGMPSGSGSSSSSTASVPGFKWGDMTKHPGNEHYVPTVSWTLGIMVLYSAAFALLAWYLDNVISDSFGARRHPLYPFQPSYWGYGKKAPYTHDFTPLLAAKQNVINDTDIVEEQRHDEGEISIALRIVNIFKTYNTIPGLGTPVHAVRGLNLKCNTGTVLALLGHNGAGKTSLINILTGLTSASYGDAFIYGYSVTHDMDEIRALMGVCPQFDVFWPDLTAREHLQIAISMKLSDTKNLQEEIDEKLLGVRLVKVANHQVQTYSGGMRRRLSVALSMVGNPKVIILDEPTTGIDPANRRYIWKLIHSIKQDKLVILTTHSMEEADRLGEKIAIMNHGILSAVGSPLHLKSKYSSGYRISFVADAEQALGLKQFVYTNLPEAILTAENAGSLIYMVPDGTDGDRLARFFSYLQTGKVVRDWGVSNTTLEDVFLRVTRGV